MRWRHWPLGCKLLSGSPRQSSTLNSICWCTTNGGGLFQSKQSSTLGGCSSWRKSRRQPFHVLQSNIWIDLKWFSNLELTDIIYDDSVSDNRSSYEVVQNVVPAHVCDQSVVDSPFSWLNYHCFIDDHQNQEPVAKDFNEDVDQAANEDFFRVDKSAFEFHVEGGGPIFKLFKWKRCHVPIILYFYIFIVLNSKSLVVKKACHVACWRSVN